MEVVGKELTLGAFGGYQSRTHSTNQKFSLKEVGLLAKYDLSKDESGRRKIYGELLLEAGQVVFIYSLKDKDSILAGYGKNALATVGVGGGCKYKISQNLELDGTIRYTLYNHDKADITLTCDGNELFCKCESRADNQISARVKMNIKKLWKIKPYAGIGYEYILEGKIKGKGHIGDDLFAMPEFNYQAGAVILIVGASAKLWKFDVDLSGQGYIGKRSGAAGTLKVKYTF
ncbi:hypothetical protein AGMMS49593_02640 [Endomicrobiia bacterium]|nr:hypothetical protein AGMMS49593_02610 [Endomicrobiia bacterium]GHT36841.1 hypothetical protein AGMMS49593_02640 [Endomicrobiia bacterium]